MMVCDPTVKMRPLYRPRVDYISTASGNIVSKSSVLHGSQNIHMSGKSVIENGAVLRGDKAIIRLGKYVIVGEGTALKPAPKKHKQQEVHLPLQIGDCVIIGKRCEIAAAQIGSNVEIGEGTTVGKRSILKDNCVILADSTVPADTTVPPFVVFGGKPGACSDRESKNVFACRAM
eukprot:Polyplicarium_translucidae@DN1984_c0_g1_i3.p2